MGTKQLTQSIKKIELTESSLNGAYYQDIEFYHQANAGDTEINLSSLILPAEAIAEGFVNPSTAALYSAKIKQNRSNVILKSYRGPWIDRIDYTVVSSSRIILKQPAEEGEVFHCVIRNVVRNTFENPDLQNIVAVGTLALGQTTFNVGKQFRINENASTQIGEILVFRGNTLAMMLRNVGNITASSTADGNYQEIDNGDGWGSTIKFNDPCSNAAGELVVVISTGRLLERPSGSMLQELEALQGYIDSIVPYVENLADLPAGTIKAAPTNVDLKAFGNKVLAVENRVSVLETPPAGVYASAWCSANFTANLTTPINFNNIEYDPYNAITPSATAWQFKCPVGKSGVYNVTVYANMSPSTSHYLNVYKSGVIYKTIGFIGGTVGAGSNTCDVLLADNDTISIVPSTSITYQGTATLSNNNNTHIAIKRIGK